MRAPLKFRDLGIGEVFQFDHSAAGPFHADLQHGPYIKVSKRGYRPGWTLEGLTLSPACVVGSVRVAVLRGHSCGGK